MATYGGNPASAAALATMDLIENGYPAECCRSERLCVELLKNLRAKHPRLAKCRLADAGR